MLQDVAIEPEVMGLSWDRFVNVLDRFGLDRGRVISQFPGAWCRQVIEHCSGFSELNKKRVVERLAQARGTRVIGFGRPYRDPNAEWIVNALHEHRNNRPFHAIVARESVPEVPESVVPDQVENTNPLFAPITGGTCPRTAIALAALLAPYLRLSREILFVDRFFRPDRRRWKEPLRCILAAAAAGRRFRRIEFHYGDHEDTLSLSELEAGGREMFQDILPDGVELTLHQWREIPRGEELHARYVLTDCVGIAIDAGLSAGGPTETTDWHLLTPDVRVQRWNSFQLGTGVYESVGRPLTVDRAGRCLRV